MGRMEEYRGEIVRVAIKCTLSDHFYKAVGGIKSGHFKGQDCYVVKFDPFQDVEGDILVRLDSSKDNCPQKVPETAQSGYFLTCHPNEDFDFATSEGTIMHAVYNKSMRPEKRKESGQFIPSLGKFLYHFHPGPARDILYFYPDRRGLTAYRLANRERELMRNRHGSAIITPTVALDKYLQKMSDSNPGVPRVVGIDENAPLEQILDAINKQKRKVIIELESHR